MILMDELFRDMKIGGHLKELKQSPDLSSRIELLNKILDRMEEERLGFYSPDEQLYLFFRIQEKGIDMGICPYFYTFYSKRNQKFHYYCRHPKLTERQRTYCRGLKTKCTFNQ